MHKRFGQGQRRTDPRALPETRHHGRPHPFDAPAGAVQDLRPAGVGLADIKVSEFTIAILIGRGARYFIEGLLAVWYGERAMAFMRVHGIALSLSIVGVLCVGMAAYLLWPKAAAGKSR